jgi:hypothetical protein
MHYLLPFFSRQQHVGWKHHGRALGTGFSLELNNFVCLPQGSNEKNGVWNSSHPMACHQTPQSSVHGLKVLDWGLSDGCVVGF